MKTEAELLVDCLQRLNHLGLQYMLTGSTAGNYWGIPRSTHDIDFVLALKRSDVLGFVSEFQGGFFLQPESVGGAFSPPYQFNALDQDSALKVDFWLLHGDEFESNTFDRRIAVSLFETPAWIATAEDLILHKLRWNSITPSDRQLRDAAGVYAVQAHSLNHSYLVDWAKRLGVKQELDAVMSGIIRPKST